jgi:hypothetical protein
VAARLGSVDTRRWGLVPVVSLRSSGIGNIARAWLNLLTIGVQQGQVRSDLTDRISGEILDLATMGLA